MVLFEMPDFTWPTELDDSRRLIEVVGSFWAQTYGGNSLVESLLHAKAQEHAQAHDDLLELVAAMSRFKLPVFHTENWSLLAIRESDLNQANLPLFDGTYRFDGQIAYDVPAVTPLFAWAVPPGLVTADVISEQITDSARTHVRGVDFYVDAGAVWFRENPFSSPTARIDDVYVGGEVTDRVTALWIYRGKYDWGTIRTQFGYILNADFPSSENYKALVNATFDGLVEGTTARCVEDLLSAACDVPLAKGTETVKYVVPGGDKTWVITDLNAYGFSPDAVVTVSAGDVVHAGDSLTDAMVFYEFTDGTVPDEVRAMTVGRGTLAAGYFQELTFENTTVPLVVEEEVDGYTKVSFEISGWPADVEKFWDDVHAKGVESNDTLAMRLDRRTTKTGQPTAVALPLTVNPLELLIGAVFRGNLFAVKVRPAAFGPDALGLHAARMLRKLVPPQTAYLVIVQVDYEDERVVMDGPGTDAAPGYEEDVDVYLGNTIEETILPADYVTEGVRVYQIEGHCR